MMISGQAMLWCALQVTVLSVAALGMGSIVGRRRPAAGAVIAASALVATVGLTAAAFSGRPAWAIAWEDLPWHRAVESQVAMADRPAANVADRLSAFPFGDDREWRGLPPTDSPRADKPAGSFSAWRAVAAGHWGAIALLCYVVGVGAMALRIGWGLAAVREYRRRSRPVVDRSMAELVDVVCAELGYCRDVELREAAGLGTPATIGWRRPILLLPGDWPSWTGEERLAVLAHEIEHVRRRDFLSWIAAQVGIALHFYHPLVHWLGARLRLQQELAADAAAARVLGGQRKYVATLAAMALRQSDSYIAWPARAFFPSSKTFLRRIEMLHRSRSLRGDLSRSACFASVAAVALAAICAAGFRGSAASDDRPAAKEKAAAESAAEIAAPEAAQTPEKFHQTLTHLKLLALAMHIYHDQHRHFPPAAVMGPDGKTPHSWRVELLPYLEQSALFEKYRKDEPWDSPHNKQVLEQMPDVFRSPYDNPKSTSSGYFAIAGPGTVFDGGKGIGIRDITDGTSNTLLIVESRRDIPWTKPEDIPFNPDKPLPQIGGFVKGEFLAAIADGSVREFDSAKVKDQLKWLILRSDQHPIDWRVFGVEQNLGPRRMRRPPPADRESRNKNNLKQLGLCMHNYHDVHSHFPPAAVPGSVGKNVMHSWRVEMLPFLEQQALYDQYRMDEPWDSPANKKVLEQMPEVFRSPYDDDPKSTRSAYFALVGRGTVFEGPKGIGISQITDGTSNTLMLVEARRNIPWTKPEDIPFDPDKPLPELGGFVKGQFGSVAADGAFHLLVTEQVKDRLKLLIMRNDSQVAEWP